MKVQKEPSAPTTANRRRGRRRRLWSRTKVKKKPKFLSLKANFPANDQSNYDDDSKEIKECQDHENVALFFSGGYGGATTLNGLLDAAVAGGNPTHLPLVNDSSSSRLDELSLSSASPTYGYAGKDPAALVRNALRSKERDSSEDKWVCYSEVVERKEVTAAVKEEEVTSSAVHRRSGIGRLSLKLDRYDEILNAWSDEGRSLYIDAQIVPNDFNNDDDFISQQGLWTVPEMVGGEISMESAAEEGKTITTSMRGDREASLLRYKAKRLNRLFSKTIRYQVRKLNAEKRPRLKGRFIKRS